MSLKHGPSFESPQYSDLNGVRVTIPLSLWWRPAIVIGGLLNVGTFGFWQLFILGAPWYLYSLLDWLIVSLALIGAAIAVGCLALWIEAAFNPRIGNWMSLACGPIVTIDFLRLTEINVITQRFAQLAKLRSVAGILLMPELWSVIVPGILVIIAPHLVSRRASRKRRLLAIALVVFTAAVYLCVSYFAPCIVSYYYHD